MRTVFLLCRDPLDATRYRKAIEAGGALKVSGIAAQAQRARRLIEAEPPDVLVTDVTLQDGTAYALLRALPAGRTKVLVLAPNPDDPALFETLRCGADAFCVDGRVDEAVHAMLAGQTQLPASVAAQLLLHFAPGDGGNDGDAFDVVNTLALTADECALLTLVAEGHSADDIATLDDGLAQTVYTRLAAIVRKLHWDLRVSGLKLQAA
jgi:DNA-binding NarL/FixJ family response regulator